MKRIFNKLFLCALVVFAAFAAFSVGAFATEDVIIPDVGVEIPSEKITGARYRFVPEVSGVYQIESVGSVDTVVTLYDEYGDELAYSDDISGENFNFSLRYDFRAGRTYYFELEAYTHFKSETVTVLLRSAAAIDGDSIEDVKLTFTSAIENLSGEVDISDARGDFFRYAYSVLGVEIFLENGEIITCSPEEVTPLTGLVLCVNDTQSYDNQWLLGENEVNVSLGTYKGGAAVTVIPNSLEKITVPDRTVIINTNGKMKKADDGGMWYCYNTRYDGDDVEVIIGGESISGTVEEIFEKTGFGFKFTSNQSAENPWDIGTHRVEYSFMGQSGSYSLTITESPVESVEIEKLTLIENYDGFEADDGTPYFYYCTDKPKTVRVTLKDGSCVTGTCEEISEYFGYDFVIEDIQSAKKPLKVGSYKIKYSFMAFDGEYEAEIIPCPVKSISVKPLNLRFESEGTFYINDEGKRVFYYESAPDEMTVYFTDGSSLCGDAEGIERLTGYKVHIDDSQDSLSWGVGEFESSLKFMGAGADYTVKISASPVKSVNIGALQLYEGIDSGSGDDGGYYYDACPEKITVIYKDGTAVTGTADEIEKQTGFKVYYPENQKWSRGKHNASAAFMGVKGNYTVTVSQNPVADFEITVADAGKEYLEGELLSLDGASLKVSYTDSTKEECKISRNPYSGEVSVYLKKLSRAVTLRENKVLRYGDEGVELSLFGKHTKLGIAPVTDTVNSVKLTRAQGESPVLTFTLADSERLDARVLCIVGAKGIYAYDYPGRERAVTLVTDKGCFNAVIRTEGDGEWLYFNDFGKDVLSVKLSSGTEHTLSSAMEKAKLIYNYYGSAASFDGNLTKKNADVLMSLAAAVSNKGTPEEIHGAYYIFTRSEIEKCLRDILRLGAVDVRLSGKYNAKTDTVRVDKLSSFANPLYGCAYDVDASTEFSVDGGCLRMLCRFTDGGAAQLLFDAEGRLESYVISEPFVHRHTLVVHSAKASTYISTGYTESVTCSGCGKVFIPRNTVAKKILGKTAKVVSAQNTSAIRLQWQAVKDATGYEVYYKRDTGWKKCATTKETTVTYTKLPAGRKYTFAIRAYVVQGGKTIKAPAYITYETSTKTVAPAKITTKQNNSAIQFNWTACKGATGYRIYRKTAKGWEVALSTTSKTTAILTGIKPGTKNVYAVRPYIRTADCFIWCDYTIYIASTAPAVPALKVSSPVKGRIDLSFGKSNGAEVYQLFYKKGNGSYKLYSSYTSPVSCSFKNLKSGTKYTFAVRAGVKTSGGWVYSSYTPVTVKVK